MSTKDNKKFISDLAPLVVEDMKKSGILASVTLAQAILESGYGRSELAKNANNLFGMKCNLSNNTWPNSTWDGKSKYTKKTQEERKDGTRETITADFRKYPSISESVGDHSAYLLGAKKGSKYRYAGLKGEKDPLKAITIIKNGEYATSSTYIDTIMRLINDYNLTKYDTEQITPEPVPTPKPPREFKDGERIKLKPGVTYYDGKKIPSWVFTVPLYYRGRNKHGVIFSRLKTGAVTGVVLEESIQ